MNRVHNAVNMRIVTPNIESIINKCDTFLSILKTSLSMRTISKICRELSNELKMICSNVGNIVDDQSSNISSFNVGNKTYVHIY